MRDGGRKDHGDTRGGRPTFSTHPRRKQVSSSLCRGCTFRTHPWVSGVSVGAHTTCASNFGSLPSTDRCQCDGTRPVFVRVLLDHD